MTTTPLEFSCLSITDYGDDIITKCQTIPTVEIPTSETVCIRL